jgi:hypothetical protein
MESLKNAELLTFVTQRTVISLIPDILTFSTMQEMPIINSQIKVNMWCHTKELEGNLPLPGPGLGADLNENYYEV